MMPDHEAQTMSTIRTTVALPVDLLSGIDAAVRSGRVASRNAFLAHAVRHELERLQREAIDRQFEMMATDAHYQREARRISDEYVTSDWEALRVAEGEP
jgi:metal-responsive CopG/Arc/MetJ family transcriptional regulator